MENEVQAFLPSSCHSFEDVLRRIQLEKEIIISWGSKEFCIEHGLIRPVKIYDTTNGCHRGLCRKYFYKNWNSRVEIFTVEGGMFLIKLRNLVDRLRRDITHYEFLISREAAWEIMTTLRQELEPPKD